MNAAVTFQIGFNDCERAIRGNLHLQVPWKVFRESRRSVQFSGN